MQFEHAHVKTKNEVKEIDNRKGKNNGIEV